MFQAVEPKVTQSPEASLELTLNAHFKMESRYGRLYVHTQSVHDNSERQAQTIANFIKENKIEKSFLDKYAHYRIVKQICVYL